MLTEGGFGAWLVVGQAGVEDGLVFAAGLFDPGLGLAGAEAVALAVLPDRLDRARKPAGASGFLYL